MKLADQIREYVMDACIRPARSMGQRQITIRASEVHRAMELENRMPAVCGALDAGKFYDQAGVTLLQRTGPHQGSTAEWVLRL
jgi:hypothetical protein